MDSEPMLWFKKPHNQNYVSISFPRYPYPYIYKVMKFLVLNYHIIITKFRQSQGGCNP